MPGTGRPPAGFSWFEHRNATLGCLFLEADIDFGLIADADASRQSWEEEVGTQFAIFAAAGLRLAGCGGNPFCVSRWLAVMAAARAEARRAFRIAYGWEIIRDYRQVVLPEMADALSGAAPYGYAAPRSVLIAGGRVLGHGGKRVRHQPGRRHVQRGADGVSSDQGSRGRVRARPELDSGPGRPDVVWAGVRRLRRTRGGRSG